MAGAFQTSREIFNNPIWRNVVEFRLFFLIYGNAMFKEHKVSDDLTLKRGEWLRSTRKLQEDLEYVENRQIKRYSTSAINRCIKRLEQSERINTTEHKLGTIFTVINYELYQFNSKPLQKDCSSVADDLQYGCTRIGQLGTGNDTGKHNNSNGISGVDSGNLERNLEQSWNRVGTELEQSWNNNNNVNKDKKEKNVKKESSGLEKAINDFKDFRNKIKRPMTDYAVHLLFLKLDKLATDDDTKIAILNQSIVNGWQGIFALKEDKPLSMPGVNKSKPNKSKFANIYQS